MVWPRVKFVGHKFLFISKRLTKLKHYDIMFIEDVNRHAFYTVVTELHL